MNNYCATREKATGEEIQAYMPGTRIQCKKCGAKGTIKGWNFCRSGKLDNVPYHVDWDKWPGYNEPSCHAFATIYACHEHIELAE